MQAHEDPRAAVGQALEVLPAVVRALRHAAAAPGPNSQGLTLTQFRLLRALSEHCVRTSELAARLEVTPATVSVAIDGLVRRGLVERLPSAGDRRAVPLGLTAEGRQNLDEALARQQSLLAGLLADLTVPERRALTVGLSGLVRVLRTRRERCGVLQ